MLAKKVAMDLKYMEMIKNDSYDNLLFYDNKISRLYFITERAKFQLLTILFPDIAEEDLRPLLRFGVDNLQVFINSINQLQAHDIERKVSLTIRRTEIIDIKKL